LVINGRGYFKKGGGYPSPLFEKRLSRLKNIFSDVLLLNWNYTRKILFFTM
jgi:hypothetical protein